jgi:hypothetical protein
VAPFSSVKSVRAHIELQTKAGCGFGIGMIWSSAWIGWAIWPGSMAIEAREEIRHWGPSTASISGRDGGMDRHLGEHLAQGQQVVDADGVVALERVHRRLRAEVAFEALDGFEEFRHQVRGDGVLDDGVAVGLQPRDVLVKHLMPPAIPKVTIAGGNAGNMGEYRE